METKLFKNWMKLTSDAALLGFEAQQVIGQRLMRIAAGGKGARFETERMVTEKIAALGEAAGTLATGGEPPGAPRPAGSPPQGGPGDPNPAKGKNTPPAGGKGES